MRGTHGSRSRDAEASIARLFLNSTGRSWLGTKLKGPDSAILMSLMMEVYFALKKGLLLTMKDAMRAIGVDHITTAQRHVAMAQDAGLLEPKREDHRAVRDGRIVPLVPTKYGLIMVEKELEEMKRAFLWLVATLANDSAHAAEIKEAAEISTGSAKYDELKKSVPLDLLQDGENDFSRRPVGRYHRRLGTSTQED